MYPKSCARKFKFLFKSRFEKDIGHKPTGNARSDFMPTKDRNPCSTDASRWQFQAKIRACVLVWLWERVKLLTCKDHWLSRCVTVVHMLIIKLMLMLMPMKMQNVCAEPTRSGQQVLHPVPHLPAPATCPHRLPSSQPLPSQASKLRPSVSLHLLWLF